MGFLGGNLICPWDDGKMFKLKQFISRLFHIEILRSTKEMHVENPFQLFQSWTKTGQRNPATSQKKGHLLHLLTLRTTWINQTEPFLKSSYWTTVLEIFAKEGVMHSLVAVDCGFIHCSGGSVQVLLVQCFIYIGRDGWKRRWCWSRTSRESKKHMMGINIKGLSQMDSNDYKSRLILAGAGDFRPAKFRKSVPAKIEHLWFNHSGTQTLRRFSNHNWQLYKTLPGHGFFWGMLSTSQVLYCHQKSQKTTLTFITSVTWLRSTKPKEIQKPPPTNMTTK